MKVCFIGKHKYPKDIFSNEQDMKTWRGMSIYFDQLFVIAQSPDLFFHKFRERNIKIYLIPNILGYFGFIAGAVKIGFYLNARYGIDVFDASEVAGGGVAVTVLKFLTGKPTVIEVQGEIFRKTENKENFKSRFLKKIGRFAMRHAARARVISHAIFNQVSEQGIPESKICLVSLRVDLNLFNPNRFGESIRQTVHFGDKVGITKIGYIGRLVDGKGLEDLFEAITILKSQNLNFSVQGGPISSWQVLIFGNGLLESKLRKIAKDLKIENEIEWRGFMPYSKVPEALSEIDIFVYPSWHEGFGRSVMEALAMEKAVAAANVGGIPDLIKDGETGLLVSPHNPKELSEKIEELIDNKELREKFGKAGREWVSRNFEWDDGIKKFANLFLELKQK